MKTVKCDICGRTAEDTSLVVRGARIHHFKKQEWRHRQQPGRVAECDICELCLHEIGKRMRKEEGGPA